MPGPLLRLYYSYSLYTGVRVCAHQTKSSVSHTTSHLFTTEHDTQHVGLHDVDKVSIIELRQKAIFVRVCAGVVDPAGGCTSGLSSDGVAFNYITKTAGSPYVDTAKLLTGIVSQSRHLARLGHIARIALQRVSSHADRARSHEVQGSTLTAPFLVGLHSSVTSLTAVATLASAIH